MWVCSFIGAKRWISQKHLQVTFHHTFIIAHFSLLFYSNKMKFLHGEIILMTNKLNPLKLNSHYHNASRCSIMVTHNIYILYIQCKKSFYYYYQCYYFILFKCIIIYIVIVILFYIDLFFNCQHGNTVTNPASVVPPDRHQRSPSPEYWLLSPNSISHHPVPGLWLLVHLMLIYGTT